MNNFHQIVIGDSPDRPALVMRPWGELASIESGNPIGTDGVLGKQHVPKQSRYPLIGAN